jgi:hypothetical protein
MKTGRKKSSSATGEHEIEPGIQSSAEELHEENHPAEDGSFSEEQYDKRGRRIRRKIKIRKRVRIKRKVSPKKKLKKALELIAWILVFASFIVTIVILVLQLDLNSKHRNKKSVHHLLPAPENKYGQFCESTRKPIASEIVIS